MPSSEDCFPVIGADTPTLTTTILGFDAADTYCNGDDVSWANFEFEVYRPMLVREPERIEELFTRRPSNNLKSAVIFSSHTTSSFVVFPIMRQE